MTLPSSQFAYIGVQCHSPKFLGLTGLAEKQLGKKFALRDCGGNGDSLGACLCWFLFRTNNAQLRLWLRHLVAGFWQSDELVRLFDKNPKEVCTTTAIYLTSCRYAKVE